MGMDFKFQVRVIDEHCQLSFDLFSLDAALSVFSDWFGNCKMVSVLDLSNNKVVAIYAAE